MTIHVKKIIKNWILQSPTLLGVNYDAIYNCHHRQRIYFKNITFFNQYSHDGCEN